MNSQYASSPPTNTMAIVSLIAGVVSWFALPLLAGVVAIVTGHMARNQIRTSFGREGGDGLALVGLVLGYLNLIASCVLPLLILGGVISVGGICSICAALTESGNFGASPLLLP
jgi:hypothetical protein